MEVNIFTTPRPFSGQYEILQTNAWRSWAMLKGAFDVTVFCDHIHEGKRTVDIAVDMGFQIAPTQRRSPRGVPLISDMFPRAETMPGLPCYTNSDIILHDDLMPALEKVAANFDSFLAVAGRWNVNQIDLLEFNPGWEKALWDKVRSQGSRMPECAIDLFAWRGPSSTVTSDFGAAPAESAVFGKMPDYAIGRYKWDNYLIGAARANNVPVIDVSPVVRIIHQQHGCVPWEDPDATANFAIQAPAGGLANCTHTLTDVGFVDGWVQTQ